MIYKPHNVTYDEYAIFITTEPRLLHKYTFKPLLFSLHIIGQCRFGSPPGELHEHLVSDGEATGPVEMVWGGLAVLIHLGHDTRASRGREKKTELATSDCVDCDLTARSGTDSLSCRHSGGRKWPPRTCHRTSCPSAASGLLWSLQHLHTQQTPEQQTHKQQGFTTLHTSIWSLTQL